MHIHTHFMDIVEPLHTEHFGTRTGCPDYCCVLTSGAEVVRGAKYSDSFRVSVKCVECLYFRGRD